jgi:diaminohydroxyphosphoribosylaminopyrimidine deaminase/5-amino-6-(5-phosphoribosylamino)uracil reductase
MILDDGGRPVGQGYHRRKGQPHAEAVALAAAGEQARGGTAVVTLEPCNHHGRTPPCHQALIDAGIRRVVVALADPTSRGDGGIARLRQAGLDVEADVLAAEARLVLGPWLQALATRRPFVRWLWLPDGAMESSASTAVPDTADLLASHDVLVTADGGVREAVPGVHGDNLQLPALVELSQPEQALASLYASGARLALLAGEPHQITPWLVAACVDEAYHYSRGTLDHELTGWDQIPTMSGRMTRVTKMSGWVQTVIDFNRR